MLLIILLVHFILSSFSFQSMNGVLVNHEHLPKNEPCILNHMDVIEFTSGFKYRYSFHVPSKNTKLSSLTSSSSSSSSSSDNESQSRPLPQQREQEREREQRLDQQQADQEHIEREKQAVDQHFEEAMIPNRYQQQLQQMAAAPSSLPTWGLPSAIGPPKQHQTPSPLMATQHTSSRNLKAKDVDRYMAAYNLAVDLEVRERSSAPSVSRSSGGSSQVHPPTNLPSQGYRKPPTSSSASSSSQQRKETKKQQSNSLASSAPADYFSKAGGVIVGPEDQIKDHQRTPLSCKPLPRVKGGGSGKQLAVEAKKMPTPVLVVESKTTGHKRPPSTSSSSSSSSASSSSASSAVPVESLKATRVRSISESEEDGSSPPAKVARLSNFSLDSSSSKKALNKEGKSLVVNPKGHKQDKNLTTRRRSRPERSTSPKSTRRDHCSLRDVSSERCESSFHINHVRYFKKKHSFLVQRNYSLPRAMPSSRCYSFRLYFGGTAPVCRKGRALTLRYGGRRFPAVRQGEPQQQPAALLVCLSSELFPAVQPCGTVPSRLSSLVQQRRQHRGLLDGQPRMGNDQTDGPLATGDRSQHPSTSPHASSTQTQGDRVFNYLFSLEFDRKAKRLLFYYRRINIVKLLQPS